MGGNNALLQSTPRERTGNAALRILQRQFQQITVELKDAVLAARKHEETAASGRQFRHFAIQSSA